ncbi:zinc finger FYVE domain-containing protein 16-like [Ornithodoros turicata]|uniref:zinc finger FYVE domain-containing protein 16-like n=1 Tax=Ornithodoros turicata TaxID=34597 RepID=UPI003139F8A8
MEKFAVDLDKVLDEFEEKEGLLGDTPPANYPLTKDSAPTAVINHVASLPKAFTSLPDQNGDHRPSIQLTTNGNHVLDRPPPFQSDYPVLTAQVLDCERFRLNHEATATTECELASAETDISKNGSTLHDDLVRGEVQNEESVAVSQPHRMFPLDEIRWNDKEQQQPVPVLPTSQASDPPTEGRGERSSDVPRLCFATKEDDVVKKEQALDSNRNMLAVSDDKLWRVPDQKVQSEEGKSDADRSEALCQSKDTEEQNDSLGEPQSVDSNPRVPEEATDKTDSMEPAELLASALTATHGPNPAASDGASLSVLLDEPITIPEECVRNPPDSSDSAQDCANDGVKELTAEPQPSSRDDCTAHPVKTGPVSSESSATLPDFSEDEVLRVSVANGVEIQLLSGDGIDLENARSEATNSSLCSLTGEATIITEDEVPAAEDERTGLNFEPATEATDRELEALLAEEEERGSVSSPQDDEEGERSFFPPLSEEEQLLGKVKPFWIPDVDAPACMLCDTRFTVLKRRHHCRACGKVLCGNCCRYKSKLPCLENKEGRVCQPCLTVLNRVAAVERLSSPNPNNPEEYCSRGPPTLESSPTNGEGPPLTVLVPVLRKGPRPGGDPPKQVVFSDGIRPGGDLSEIADGPSVMPASRPRGIKEVTLPGGGQDEGATPPSQGRHAKKVVVSDAEGTLPPILLTGSISNENFDATKLMSVLKDENAEPVTFALTKNLHVFAKIVKLDCCMNCNCWCFSSSGLSSLGQDEVLLLFDHTEVESTVPRDALRLFSTLHDNAVHGGGPIGSMGHLLFPDGVLGSRDQSGFLFVPPTLQCVKKLPLPRAPWLAAVLVHRWEVPWAKLLPLRLVLRLGSEYRYYPCPLMSTRFRKPVYGEVGHTIMNVLLDFRNFQYGLPSLGGLVVHIEGQRTTVHVPRNRYDALCRVLDSNEHVLALGANLSPSADSHLVCVQGDEGTYRTQAVHVAHEEQKITGATFVVFSGALKGTGDAKCSVVEDGLLVQLSPTAMAALRTALRAMKDWEAQSGPEESITVVWEEDDRQCNVGVTSPIDNQSREGVPSVRIRNATDYSSQRHVIRWTEVFFLHMDDAKKTSEESQRVSEALAKSFSMAMLPHLSQLHSLGVVGLRVELGPERVGYEAGSNGKPLPASCLSELDCALVPLLTTAQERLAVELVFHVLLK